MILTKNGNLMKFASGAAVNAHIVDPYNPLGLPPFTIRCKFKSGYTPAMGDSQTLVDAEENVWDIYKNSTDWSNLLIQSWADGQYPLLKVLGANTTGVTNMYCLFAWPGSNGQSNLSEVALFDTSSVTNMKQMFQRSKITIIPLFDTSSCTNMQSTFSNCLNVESGALALYQQASSQTNVPTHDWSTFNNCGRDTVTGAAELAQIPKSWGGTAS